MKKFKKMMAIVLSLAVVLAFSVPSMAASITLKDGDTHTYDVYQVLTGTLASEGSNKLGNPAWGQNAKSDAGTVDAFITQITAEGLSEAEIADLVAAKVDLTSDPVGEVKDGSPLQNLANGYYILVDKTEIAASEDGKIDTKSLHVVQVLNNKTLVNIKYGTTESDKEIVSDTLGDGEDAHAVGGDVDNVSIGDTVNFKITAKIPENASDYNYFYFVINDTLDPGLTLNADSITVYKESIINDNKLALNTDYLVKTGTDAAPKSFQVGLVDAKSLAGKDIIVTYSAVLNENATIGEVPNKNTSTVTFSNDPNHDYNGENDNPGFPDSEDSKVTGETPASETKTYTTGIEIQKVDEDGNVLTGAEFTITGNSTEIVLVSKEVFRAPEAGETAEYYKLKGDKYTKEAPVTADYMKEAPAGATAGYVEDAAYTGDDKVVIGDKTYRPYKPAEDTDKTVYILVKKNSDLYEETTAGYVKDVTYEQKDTTGQGAVEASAYVGADGVVRFVGLGAGEYTITETHTPEGYNTIAPITVNIAFTANPTGENAVHWSKTSGDATYNATTGVFEIKIENRSGSELPSTGGIGTTIFYVLGALLVVGAGVLLVTRRRMKTNQSIQMSRGSNAK